MGVLKKKRVTRRIQSKMSEDRVAPCNNSQEMFKEINSMIEKFQMQMKVIKDTAMLTENDEIKS